jgi:NADH dehydrogenase [ubiquinone] 1 alpha subcomplex assembly factor 7
MSDMESSPVDSLRRRLATSGPMSVGEYMAWCLTGTGTAYYRGGNPLGAAGDFVTAPEVSQIFGELIAVWACSMWEAMGRPAPFVLAELGPGRGTLMQDALRAARSMPGFLEAAQIHLVETSATLRDKQDQLLSQFCRPQWHETVMAVPGEPLIVIANEFFDALPVEQHIYDNGSWRRRLVSLDEAGRLSFSAGRLALPPVELIPPEAPRDSDILEHRPAAAVLIQEFGRRARSAPFAMLICDYGYERRDYGDTLQAVRAHGYADPLETPGEADLSAHVNFAELAHVARTAGLAVWGPLPQSDFLLSLGLQERLRVLMASADEEQRAALFLGARRLVDPFQMGSLFKVMAMTGPDLPAPPPFKVNGAAYG